MTLYLSPISTILQYFSNSGVVLSGGQVFTYLAGTSTKQNTYTDSTGNTQNANPITLDSTGRLPNVLIWQPAGVSIKVIITDAMGNQLGPTFDQIAGINDFTNSASSLANPASGSGADLVANAMRSYDVFSSMRSANVPNMSSGQTLIVDVQGQTIVGDSLGGEFYWSPTSTVTDDDINVIKPTSASGAGRYLRLSRILYASKVTFDGRANTTTTTPDPDLQITIPESGIYSLEAFIHDAGGTSAGGLSGTFAYSGTLGSGYWAAKAIGTHSVDVPLSAVNGSAQELQSSQSGTECSLISGVLGIDSSGVLSFNWAQNTSNSTASLVSGFSWMRATRLQ